MPKVHGFTLIELLVVIAIIAILAVIGITVFTGVQRSARDTKRRSDIDAIAKAYEVKYQNNSRYVAVIGSDFTASSIPKDPDGVNDYYQALASDGSSFKVCASLEANSTRVCSTQSTTCICKNSAISSISSTATLNQVAGGVVPTPTVSLTNGLIAYWRMDESPQTGPLADSKGSNSLTVSGPSTNVVAGKITNAHSFNGSSDYLTSGQVFPTGASAWSNYSISMWVNPVTVSGNIALLVQAAPLERTGDTEIFIESGNLWFDRYDGTNNHGDGAYIPVSSVTINQWNHLVVTWSGGDNGTGAIYVNGVDKSASQRINAAFGDWNLSNLTFGGNYPGYYFNGQMDEIGIWNRTLSSSEVSQLFNSNNGTQVAAIMNSRLAVLFSN